MVDQMENNSKKTNVTLNSSINSLNEDFIGIDYYIENLNNAIDNGARKILISSGFGGGKSSICNLLERNKRFNHVSRVSLWDISVEEKKLTQEEQENTSLYKSFLFKLSSDFCGREHSKHVSKLLNKSTGLIKIWLKNKKTVVLFVFLLIFIGLFLLSNTINGVNWFFVTFIENALKIDFSIKIVSYIFLIIAGCISIFLIQNGNLLYSSWKAEQNRLITIEDYISIYSDIIIDSCKDKLIVDKNLIIIEDIDRCFKDGKEKNVTNFLKNITRLVDYSIHCDKNINTYLNSVVLIICLDESMLLKCKENESVKFDSEVILKIFDYQLNVGNIHQDDFTNIFKKLVENYDLSSEEIKQLNVILNSDINSIRLLKNEINDCYAKYRTLEKRFSANNIKIRFAGCVAYAYLKNNFPIDFYKMLENKGDILDNLKVAINNNNLNKSITIDAVGYEKKFKEKLIELIKIDYIDKDYRIYFYNYPKDEPCKNVYEYDYWQFIKGKVELNKENNLHLSSEYILNISEEVNSIKMAYPLEILNDNYIMKVILEQKEDGQLLQLLKDNLILNDENGIKLTYDFLVSCIENNFDLTLLKKYILEIYESIWKNNTKICDSFYMLRKILVKIYKNDIIKFKKFFEGEFNSLIFDEFKCIEDKQVIYSLINLKSFNNDLELIIPLIKEIINSNENINLCKIWAKHINSFDRYCAYAVDVLYDYNNYSEEIFASFGNDYKYLENNIKFAEYLNKIIYKADRNILQKINKFFFYFGLTEDSLVKFSQYQFFNTPLAFYLYNHEFDKIEEININLNVQFNDIKDRNIPKINSCICDFKIYILKKTQSNKFDYLFYGIYEKDFEINFNDIVIKNIHLLFIIKEKCFKNIQKYISENNVILDKEILNILLNELYKNIDIVEVEESDYLVLLLNEKVDLCLEIYNESTNNIFKKFIDKVSSNYICRLIIYIQVKFKILLPEYYNHLLNYFGEEKIIYAEYINSLEDDKITYTLLNSVGIYYKYRDYIIEFFIKNSNIEFALAAAILNDRLSEYQHLYGIATFNELTNLYNNNETKGKLLRDEKFIIDGLPHIKIKPDDHELLANILLEKNLNLSFTKNMFKCCSNEIIILILKDFKDLNKNQTFSLIRVLEDKHYKRLVLDNNEVYDHLYSNINKDYRGAFTKKFKINEYDIA